MSTKLPSINFIKNKNLNLILKPLFNQQEIKKISRNNKFLFKNKNKNRTTNSTDDINNKLKKIGLSSLMYRKPKSIYNKLLLSTNKKMKEVVKIPHYRHSKIFNCTIPKSSSVKILPTGSSLKRLTTGNIDEIEKFKHYQNIESSKTYQDYLIKERAYIPQESINTFFIESYHNNNKDTIKFSLNKNNIFRNSIYDSLNPLNKKNTMIIKSKFRNQDKFEKYLIERFIKTKYKAINKNYTKNRIIFIILDGEILINENDIKGHFIEIPTFQEIKLLNEERRQILMKNILEKCQKLFNRNGPLISIFSPDKELISDIKEIKEEYLFLYVSNKMIYNGISLVTTPNFLKIYNKGFKKYLKIEKMNKLKNDNAFKTVEKKFKRKIKEVNKGIRLKYEKYKPHYSYAEGEKDLEYEEFIIYSDNEKRKSSIEKNFSKKCNLKNDFFIYLSEKNTAKNISELKKKLNYDKPFDLRESYKQFEYNFDKLIEKYKKEIQRLLKINQKKIYSIDDIDSKIYSHNLKYPKDQLTKLYITKINKRPFKREQMKYDTFYSCVDKNVTKYYNPFILYNIPKLLSEFKNYTRRRLFEIYSQYKDLVVMSYSKNKSDFILQRGVDFDTFWMCVEQLSDEKKKFVEKIYNQINRSKLCVLNMQDFLRGMYFIQNTDITEKLDLFLKALDISGKGVITFDEAVEISKDAIQRNLTDKKDKNSNNIYALNELSQFFAVFIFRLIGVEENKVLKLYDLKKAIIENKNNEFNEIEYLEMFCGANK